MNTVLLLARRELSSFLSTTWGFIILATLLFVDGLLFNALAMGDEARYSADVLEDFFEYSSGITMVASILLTMRLIAEERQTATIVLLETAPVSEAQIVVGKFLGAFGFLTLLVLTTLYMPVLVQINGKVSWGQIGAGYLGLLSLGAATTAMGTFGSALARNQILAAVLGGGIVVLFILGWLTSLLAEPPLSDIFAYAALFDRHFEPFMRGRINTESLVFYGSLTFLFLLLATRVLQSRRLA